MTKDLFLITGNQRYKPGKMRRKFLVGVVCAALFFFLVISSMLNTELIHRIMPNHNPPNDVSCYEEMPIYITDNYDILDDEDKVPNRQNIFFHETSCFDEEGATFSARQACAVESAAKMNPKATIYLLFTSPIKFANGSREIVKSLLSYKNIKVKRIIMKHYIRDTPLKDWYTSNMLLRSQWPRSHMSDILRYLTLWKYGGIYLDLDVVVTKSLENMTNFAGAEDWEDVAAGAIGLAPTGLGRSIANACIKDLMTNFRGDVWGNNGPGVITRTLRGLCQVRNAEDMTKNGCRGFKVFPPSAFYPIHYKKWKKYFDEKDSDETLKKVENSLAIHVWNKLSSSATVKVGSKVPYAIIAERYCPNVYSNCGDTF